MLPRYLRFARTVALVTSSATAGCRGADTDASAETKETGAPDGLFEAGEGDARSEATDADADATSATEGACRILVLDGATEIACAAGSMCSSPENDAGDADRALCTFGVDAAAPDGGVVAECGVITCGANCYCAGPAVSLCGCLHLGSAGPLAPPDLPLS